jgi:hypothetical protein
MRTVVQIRSDQAIIRDVRSDKESDTAHNDDHLDAQSGDAIDPWFRDAARQLLGTNCDAGLVLQTLTGVPARTAHRYAKGQRPPTAHIVRELIRSEGGWQWLAALMDGAQPQWWRDMDRARRIAAQFDSIPELRNPR